MYSTCVDLLLWVRCRGPADGSNMVSHLRDFLRIAEDREKDEESYERLRRMEDVLAWSIWF